MENLNKEQQVFLEKFIENTKRLEDMQVRELIQYCTNKYQFAKTHSVYLKDWEKTKEEMQNRINAGSLGDGLSIELVQEMIKAGENIIDEKLKKVREAFLEKFGESIYNYIGEDGKTKKLFGIF